MLALTVHQPWAWAIIHGGRLRKDVENRSWKPPAALIGQRIAIHASKTFDRYCGQTLALLGITIEWPPGYEYGAIIGTVKVVRCEGNHQSAWAIPDQWHWVLSDPIALDKPIPCRGYQGLWNVPEEIVTAMEVKA